MSDIIDRLMHISEAMMEGYPFNDGDFVEIDCAIDEIQKLRKELDETKALVNTEHKRYLGELEHHVRMSSHSRGLVADIISEIDCRIEHGAESNGHLEAMRDLIKKKEFVYDQFEKGKFYAYGKE